MSGWWFIPMLMGIQFVLFEHKHTKWFRNIMNLTWFTKFLSNCVFCRCCWIGAALTRFVYHNDFIQEIVLFGLASGFIGMFLVVTFTPMLRVWERSRCSTSI